MKITIPLKMILKTLIILYILVEGLWAGQHQKSIDDTHARVLKQAEVDRLNDPDLYLRRLAVLDRFMQNATRYRGGVAVGVDSVITREASKLGQRTNSTTEIRSVEAVPFLLEIVIKGPPLALKNKSEYANFNRKSKEYDLWIRCLAAGLVGKFRHPEVLPVLTNRLKTTKESKVRSYIACGLGLSMDPNVIEVLLSSLADSDMNVRKIAWAQLNYMTSRGFTPGVIPNERQIAEFREWWQGNREDVVRKFYNPQTGRLEPKFENKRSQESAPSDQPVPVPQNTRSMDDYTSLCVVITGWPETMHNDPTVSWLVQYNDPNGEIAERQKAFYITSNSQSIILEWVDTGGELLATLIQNEVKRPWIYVENVKTSKFEYLNLPRDGDFILPLDRFVSIQIRSADWSRLQTFRELRLYHKENARLPLYTIPLASGQVDTDRGAWSAGIELVPMVYYIHATGGPDDGSVSLGTLDVQDNSDKTYTLSFGDRKGLKEP